MSNYCINYIIDILKIFFINLGTLYISIKLINKAKIIQINKFIINIFILLLYSIICKFIKEYIGFSYGIVAQSLMMAVLLSLNIKKDLFFSILSILISLSINYIIFFISIDISYIPNVIFNIQYNYLGIILIGAVYFFLINCFLKLKKFKKGFAFLQNKIEGTYFSIIILNISLYIMFIIIIFVSIPETNFIIELGWGLLFLSILMFLTIQKSLQFYYKQKILIQDLNETKEELENKNKEIEELERENLNFSKTSHSIAHKQKALEYKLNQLMLKNEIADEIDLKDRIHTISKEISERTTEIELSKTDIPEIDDMLKYMQSECIKNKIDFQLKINGNIHHMVNKYVSKEDLEILLADHIKNAITAINYSENINKSILVRLGNIDGIFSLYVYDSGIEFEKETLIKLGKKPVTTHADNGGTGMGFMNTFDTLNKYRASITIEEHNKPCKEDFTKLIKIEFDDKNEYKIVSYRYEEIKENCEKSIDIILKKW